MRRWLAAALLAGTGAGVGTAALAAQSEPGVPEPYRRASEALVGVLFPEARRDWSNGDLLWPDGRQQKLSLTGLTWVPRGGGWWLAAGVEFPDAFDEQVQRLKALKRPTERQALRIVIAKANADFGILEHRVFEPDPESPLSKLVVFTLLELPTGAAAETGWPRLHVRGVSGALLAGGAGLVWWDGELDVTSMSWPMRGPSELWRKEGDGTETRDNLGAAQMGPGTVALQGLRSGASLSFACTAPCDIHPYAALEAAAAAAKRPAKTPGP